MYILTINAGSSSVKFTLFTLDGLNVVSAGVVERVGLSGTQIQIKNTWGQQTTRQIQASDTAQAVGHITALLTVKNGGAIQSAGHLAGIGHRVVHGGETIRHPVRVDDHLKQVIKECFPLAPLHNPPNLVGIEACEGFFPGTVQVAVFDTAFHTTLPEYAYLYGLPYAFYREDKIRRYGFHGTSHQYVCRTAADFLEKPLASLKIISCHLGNGCSVTAVNGGRSVDTSMGFTPLEGLLMGTRCGDIDPAIVFYLMDQKGMAPWQVNELLNKQSGLLGLAGVGSSDLRDIFAAGKSGNRQADTALDVFVYRIKKYIGAYAFAMGGVDAVIFTGGIGENSPQIRQEVCRELTSFGIIVDPVKNTRTAKTGTAIQADDSQVKILVIPADEEREIALQTLELLSQDERKNI